ncbi:Dual specificity protein phosphatase 14 [Portunus trituberculatus]|uniref:Dual specificity protein phosphatase 14 n=2 Tax=Portunus trituberculatus TaxID=210409 RepID=A0A5B7HKF1_PORTR|nr:Dual specificity protein phosphatase 14 [Portunus trituberculatus]
MSELGVTCVVNATTELPNAPLQGVRVVAVRVADDPSADLASHLAAAADTIHQELCGGGRVLVHCVAGVSRSPALVLAYLVRHGGMTLREAFLHVRAARPSARPNSGFFSQLIEFEREERGCGSVVLHLTPGGWVPDVCLEEAAAMQDKSCLAALSDRRGLQRVYA